MQSHIFYDKDNALRTWTYDNGELVSDVRGDGKSVFYDKANNKTYTCNYKNGEPFEGTKFEYDSDYDGITSIQSFKNGVLDGESTEYTYQYTDESYTAGSLIPEYVYNYKNGLKEGPAKQFYKDRLIKTMNYSSDMLDGEYTALDLEGNILSTLIYKEDYPFQGNLVDYDYSTGQLLSISSYSEGNLEGDQKYFENGSLQRLETYEAGTLLKEVSYLMGYAYELTYRNSEPFEGKKIDTYSYTISEYSDGTPVSIKTYTGNDYMNLVSSETFEGESSIKTLYYGNGKPKEITQNVGTEREGKATYYNAEGKEIATGIFESDLPSSGTFAYYNTTNESDYLILQIDKNLYSVTEYTDGIPGKNFQYKRTANSDSAVSDDIQKFLSSVQLMFDSYTFDVDSNTNYEEDDLYY
jgi:antitoxin component YwqK of YwqJK toxin-antitoxin module